MDLRQSWMEERLVWNKDEYNGSEYIHLSSGDLWNPEIVLYNNADGKFMPSLSDTKARVDWSGEVTWNPLSIFKANCDLRVKQFPYDIQVLSFTPTTANNYVLQGMYPYVQIVGVRRRRVRDCL